MNFYVNRNRDKTIHVQNAVMGHFGQHHVHNSKSFKKWKEDLDESSLIEMEGNCKCKMKAGETCNGMPKKKK